MAGHSMKLEQVVGREKLVEEKHVSDSEEKSATECGKGLIAK